MIDSDDRWRRVRYAEYPARLHSPRLTDEDVVRWADEHRAEVAEAVGRISPTSSERSSPCVRAQVITLPLEGDTEQVRARAAAVLARALAGEDFEALAEQFSETAAPGKRGQLEWFLRGHTVAAFDAALWDGPLGEVYPEVLEIDAAIYIVRIAQQRPEGRTAQELELVVARRLAEVAIGMSHARTAANAAVEALASEGDPARAERHLPGLSDPLLPGDQAFYSDIDGAASREAFLPGPRYRVVEVDQGYAVIEPLACEPPDDHGPSAATEAILDAARARLRRR